MSPSESGRCGLLWVATFSLWLGQVACESTPTKPLETGDTAAAVEVVDCDGEGPLDEEDLDEDGFSTCGGDCDDLNPRTYPGAAFEDSATDCMNDQDGDGYGRSSATDGVVAGTDCNDANTGLHPFVDSDGTQGCGWREVSAGWHHTCGIDSGRAVVCWGSDASGQLGAPEGEFLHVASGERHTCALSLGGDPHCWGDDSSGQSSPPMTTFSSLSAGSGFTCGVEVGGAVLCWGVDTQGQVSDVPVGSFIQVSVGQAHGCALDGDALPHCWGWNSDGQSTAPEIELVVIDMGVYHSCGLDPESSLQCWGRGYQGEGQGEGGGGEGEAPIEILSFLDLAASAFHTCMVTTEEALFCLGVNDQGQSRPPLGLFRSVTTGQDHSCAIDDAGALSCWGSDEWGQASPP